MRKPLIILDVMYKYINREWILWTDDEVFINPGMMDYFPIQILLLALPLTVKKGGGSELGLPLGINSNLGPRITLNLENPLV